MHHWLVSWLAAWLPYCLLHNNVSSHSSITWLDLVLFISLPSSVVIAAWGGMPSCLAWREQHCTCIHKVTLYVSNNCGIPGPQVKCKYKLNNLLMLEYLYRFSCLHKNKIQVPLQEVELNSLIWKHTSNHWIYGFLRFCSKIWRWE